GIQAELSDERVRKNPSAACFASSTQADLTSDGFKLVGSAQVWKDESLLQQGSLPLKDRAAEFFAMLRFPSEEARQEALEQYNQKTTPLNTFAPQASWEMVAQAFQYGFSEALGVRFEPGVLSAEEWAMAHQLVEEKYSKLVWRQERVRLVRKG
ncbi:MAG: lipoate--protein ligase family protein, partial [Ktedonobacteraceae bacterium]|nr:lipoate--protein ligase family protein [Ktedonobacteraceae bacterium]